MRVLGLVGLECGSWRRAVTLDVMEEDVIVLLGRNGAGKTTLLNTVAGLLPVKAGQVFVSGTDVTRCDELGRVAAGIRIGLEGRQVFERLTVKRNLMLGAFGRPEVHRARRDLDWVLSVFPDLRAKLNEPAGHLSGGQQTLVSVARALMGDPVVLLLDEPTLGLDPQNAKKVVQAVWQIRKERKMTAVVAEQSGAFAVAFPEHVVLMIGGEFVFRGTLDDAVRRGVLAEVMA